MTLPTFIGTYITIDFGRPNRIRKLWFDIIICILYIVIFRITSYMAIFFEVGS